MGDKVFYAHSNKGPPETWQRLEDHLRAVAEKAAEFAGAFSAADCAYLAGLWHDVGKYSEEFQAYLRSQSEACAETQPGRVDHSSAGAQYAAEKIGIPGHLLSYAIAGHHAGLLDGRAEGTCQEKRLKKAPPAWRHGLAELPQPPVPRLPEFLRKALGEHDAFAVAFFVRMIFSCLVDADFLDTERAMNPGQTEGRRNFPILGVAPRTGRVDQNLTKQRLCDDKAALRSA